MIQPHAHNARGIAQSEAASQRAERLLPAANRANRFSGSGINRSAERKMFEEGHVIIGSPDEVADKIREAAIDLNVGNLLMLLHFGNMSRDLTNYNTQLFAEKVMPQLTDLFEDKWEHKWWPEPMAAAKRVMQTEAAE